MKKILVPALLVFIIQFFIGCSGSFTFHDGYNISGSKVFFKKPFPGGTIEIAGADAVWRIKII